jgi:TMEM175 potassium channel family protein
MERERDLERLLTFVDAVVAIAITLLILPLAEAGGEAGTRRAAEVLPEHANDILGFVISFLVIARLWVGQHRLVSSLVRQNSLIIWLMLAWTFTIVVLPFPTRLITGSGDDLVARVFYIGTMTVSSALLTALAVVLARTPDLHTPDARPDVRPSLANSILFLLALAISVAFPATTYWPLLLLALAGLLARVLPRRLTRA